MHKFGQGIRVVTRVSCVLATNCQVVVAPLATNVRAVQCHRQRGIVRPNSPGLTQRMPERFSDDRRKTKSATCHFVFLHMIFQNELFELWLSVKLVAPSPLDRKSSAHLVSVGRDMLPASPHGVVDSPMSLNLLSSFWAAIPIGPVLRVVSASGCARRRVP